MGKAPIKYREAILGRPNTDLAGQDRFLIWHYWGWIDNEWIEPESGLPSNSFMFTGEIDVNGKEIYEGDIIAYGGDNHNGVVVFGEYEGAVGFYTEEGVRLRGTDKKKRWHGLPPTTDMPEVYAGRVSQFFQRYIV